MTRPTVLELDCETGISTEREMTDSEFEAMQERQANFEAQLAADASAAEAKAAAKASAEAKLATLGLTAEEIAALSN
jgi:hypothetical protein